MAKSNKEVASDKEAAADTFEDCLKKLEKIVEDMEEGELSLEELVKQYEQGSSLLTRCDSFLRSARERIELITLKAKSGLEEDVRADDPPEDTDDDEIRLF